MDETSQPPLFDESMPGPSPISGTLNGATSMEEEEAPRRDTASPVGDVDGDQAADQAKQKRQ